MADDWSGNRVGGGTGAASNGRVQSLGNGQRDDHANQPHAESQPDLQFASGSVAGDVAGSSGVPPAGDGPRALYLRKAYLTDRARLDQVGDKRRRLRATACIMDNCFLVPVTKFIPGGGPHCLMQYVPPAVSSPRDET